MSELFTVDNLKIGDGLSLVRSDEGARDKFTLSLSRDILESDGIIHFDHTDLFKGRCAIWHGKSGAVGFESDIEPRSMTYHDGGILLDFSDFGNNVSGSVWFSKSKQSMLTPFKVDCHDVTIENKVYHACRIGWGEIGPIFTTENYNGSTGAYYNNDNTLGAIYGRLVTPAEIQTLDAIQETNDSDYRAPINHHYKSLLTLLSNSTSSITTPSTVSSLVAKALWTFPGADSYEFKALSGGFLNMNTSAYGAMGTRCFFGVMDMPTRTIAISIYSSTTQDISDVGVSNGAFSIRFMKKFGIVTIDGIDYKTCYLGNTWWTAENDRGTRFGQSRPVEANTPIYGTVYNFESMLNYDNWLKSQDSKLRVPRSDEYRHMNAVGSLGLTQMKSATLWTDTQGNNQAGFNATPGGYVTDTNTQYELGTASRYGTLSKYDSINSYCFYIGGSNIYFGTAQINATTRYSALRLVQRFFDVPMPWGEVRRFVKIGHYFIDTKNFDWVGEDGTLGRFYQDNEALGLIHGRLYNHAEMKYIEQYLRDMGIPLGVPAKDEWIALLSYSNGTHGTTLPQSASAFTNSGTNDFELGLTASGWLGNTGVFAGLDGSDIRAWANDISVYSLRINDEVPSFALHGNATEAKTLSLPARLIFRAF